MGESTNDFIKINNEKVVFIYLSQYNRQFIILLIKVDLYNEGLYPKEMSIDLYNYIPTQIKGFAYNRYLLFASTGIFENELDYILQDQDFNDYNYLSIFMAFGYGNGTDDTIDITRFLNKERLDGEDSFIYYLYKNLKIENNILGYMPLGLIRLVSFPKELSIFLYNYQEDKEINLSEENLFQELYQETLNPNSIFDNMFIFSECIFAKILYSEILENGEFDELDDCPEFDYIIRDNSTLTKTSQYYYIDFQHFLMESRNQNLDSPQAYARRLGKKRKLNVYDDIYPGRINRIKFKLCHKFCDTCNELSTSDTEQKCKSCLSEYQYDYLYFLNKTEKNPDNICVKEGYYYNKDENRLAECRDSFRFYVNTTDNKRICFPNYEDEYPCPASYPIYNKTSKECFYCDFKRFINGECTAENLTMESCTKCTYECFIIGGCNYNDFNNANEDFYERIKNGGYLSNYDGGADLKIKNGDGYAFQITTFGNELNNLKENKNRNFSIIDFKDCADLLRSQNNLESNEDLVILKYENDNQVSNGNEKSIQYEVYLPNSNTKLDLSVCNNTSITKSK